MEGVVIGRWLSEAAMTRKWCDVSILCGGRHFWAHRLVLSTASPFIRGLLLSRPSDDVPTTIVFADFSHEIVEALLQYIYSGEVSVLPEHVDDFLALSQALKIHVDYKGVAMSRAGKKNRDLVYDDRVDSTGKANGDCYLGGYLSNGVYYDKCLQDVAIKKKKKKKKDDGYYDEEDNEPQRPLIDQPDSPALNLSSRHEGDESRVNSSTGRLVRPIPSLMPIESVDGCRKSSSSSEKRVPDLLDLSTLRRGELAYNNAHSAFERVAHHRQQLHGVIAAKLAAVANNHRREESPQQQRRNGTARNMPYNRVMESPWSARRPIVYTRHRRHRAEEETPADTSSASQVHFVCDVTSAAPKCVETPFNDDNNNSSGGGGYDRKQDVVSPTTTIVSGGGEPLSSVSIKDPTSPSEASSPELNGSLPPPSPHDDDACALKCASCFKMFTSRSTLAAHEATHASRARYRCDQCDKSFSQLRNYKYHVSVHKGTKEFAATCNVCGKYFNDRGYLSSHMKIHRNRKEYQCPHCPKSFNQRVAYNMHVRIHTGVKPHQCEACGKAFSRKMLLKQHARTHSGEKPYACSACGKRFADRSNMTLHMRLHSGVKPFSCNLCPKSFTKKHHLKTHLNYHTGNKPYACSKCGLTFSQSSNMRTHMKKCSANGDRDDEAIIIDPVA